MDTGSWLAQFLWALAYFVAPFSWSRIKLCKFLLSCLCLWVAPPFPLLVVLGGPPSPFGRCPPGSVLFFVSSLLWLGLFVGRPSLFSPRPSGLNPVGFLFFAFWVWLSARFVALLA